MINAKNFLSKGFLAGVGFSSAILLSAIAYAAIANVSSGQTLTADKMNELINAVNGGTAVPRGAIMAFNSTECPSGWKEANGDTVPYGTGGNSALDLRGEFLRGWDNGRGVDAGRGLGSAQAGTNHVNLHINSNIYYPNSTNLTASNYETLTTGGLMRYAGNAGSASSVNGSTYTARPRNVSVMYCVKQ